MYYIYGVSGPSLLMESTNSMIGTSTALILDKDHACSYYIYIKYTSIEIILINSDTARKWHTAT